MLYPINLSPPRIMHIDLNSCFATIEQQANPHLRGKPIVVAAYTSDSGCILSPSIEAKKLGIKTGMRVFEAKNIYPRVIVKFPDPDKYRDVHKKFMKIFKEYSPDVVAKSIDEAVIDFSEYIPKKTTSPDVFFRHPELLPRRQTGVSGSALEFQKMLNQGSPDFIGVQHDELIPIAKEIKHRLRQEVGEWISCSIGIGMNRFLAKLGASIKKPDGLVYIDGNNLLDIYRKIKLLDFCGINVRTEDKLKRFGIVTPLQFFQTDARTLHKIVFQSIIGFHWHMEMRGWEVTRREYPTKSYGQQYALKHKTQDEKELLGILYRLTEKMGRRLRKGCHLTSGTHIGCLYEDRTYDHEGRSYPSAVYTTFDLFSRVKEIFLDHFNHKNVALLSVTSFNLTPATVVQESLFENTSKKMIVADAMDKINNRYGEYTIAPALTLGMHSVIHDRIAFGRSAIVK